MIKIAVCDDEQASRQDVSAKLKGQLANEEYLIYEFSSGEQLINSVKYKGEFFHIIFLDIQMGELNGIETAKRVMEINEDAHFVFVSSYKEYVFEAFDVNAINFLLKPASKEKLEQTVAKILQRIGDSKNYILIEEESKITKVFLHNIQYCEALNHKVFICDKENIYRYKKKLDSLEKELTDNFFRCHRSYIVNLNFVLAYENNFAHMPKGEKIPVAVRRYASFMEALLNNKREQIRK